MAENRKYPLGAEVPIREGQVLTGPQFSEPMRVETVRSNGPDVWVAGLVGQQSEQFRRVTLTSNDISSLTIADAALSYDGNGRLLRIGLQAYSLGIAYEFDPYFGLSISRVDPLPHQLEAVYEHLLKLPTVRFLLADDAGAGKTIMAGLLIRELKLRGLIERVLVVCPANLAFQWQRELKEKFDEPKTQTNSRLVRRAVSIVIDPWRAPDLGRVGGDVGDSGSPYAQGKHRPATGCHAPGRRPGSRPGPHMDQNVLAGYAAVALALILDPSGLSAFSFQPM